MTQFFVSSAPRAPMSPIESTELLRLSTAGQAAFAKAVINPSKPNAALKRAFERHQQLIVD